MKIMNKEVKVNNTEVSLMDFSEPDWRNPAAAMGEGIVKTHFCWNLVV